jgi:glycine cleavage system aminomethyltransferase T
MSDTQRIRETCGLAEDSRLVKFDLKGFGLKAPPAPDARCACWRLGNCHYLVTCQPSEREPVRAWIRSREQRHTDIDLPQPVYCTEVTSVYADLLLAGPASREVLSKLTSLDVSDGGLPNLSCGQASLAHAHALVLREDLTTIPAFHLLVGRDVGESVRESLLHAGEEFHILPFRLEASGLI